MSTTGAFLSRVRVRLLIHEVLQFLRLFTLFLDGSMCEVLNFLQYFGLLFVVLAIHVFVQKGTFIFLCWLLVFEFIAILLDIGGRPEIELFGVFEELAAVVGQSFGFGTVLAAFIVVHDLIQLLLEVQAGCVHVLDGANHGIIRFRSAEVLVNVDETVSNVFLLER